MTLKLNGRDSPRAQEVLESIASRKGPVQLDIDQIMTLISLGVSLVGTGAVNLRESRVPPEVLARVMLHVGTIMLELLRVDRTEVKTLVDRLLEDQRQ